ncbi:MAG: hypothetical protein RLY57_383, partial [Candidatus Parcubacteria bacterium]
IPSIVIKGEKVGIGSTSPYATLSIKGGGNTTGLLFQATNSDGVPKVTILDNGNLGIGTSTPAAALSVGSGNAIIDGFTKSSYFTATSTSATSTFAGGLTAASSLYVLQNGNVGIGTTSPYVKLSVNGQVAARNFIATSTLFASDFYGGIDVKGKDIYNVHNITGSSSKVGINNNNPAYNLDVVGNINFSSDLYQNGSVFAGAGPGVLYYGNGEGDLDFSTGLFWDKTNSRLSVNNNGTPQYTLDVTGDINFTGSLYKNGSAFIPAAAGGDTQVQYNNAGTLSGDNQFIWNNSSSGLTIGDNNSGGTGVKLTIKPGQTGQSANLTEWYSTGNQAVLAITPNYGSIYNPESGGANTGAVTVDDSLYITQDVHVTGSYYGDGSNLTGVTAASPFNQDLNTSDTPVFAGLTLGTNYAYLNSASNYVEFGGFSSPLNYFTIHGPTYLDTSYIGDVGAFGNVGALCIGSESPGRITYNPGATDCVVSSKRFKNNIKDLTAGLDIIEKLRPVSYTLKTGSPEDIHVGLIAEEVYEIDPRLTARTPEGEIQSVRYSEFTAILTKAIQELWSQVKPILAWFSSDGSQFKVQGEVCVDDVCITKEQFKELLINAGGAAAPINSSDNTNDNSENATATSSDQVSGNGNDTASATEEDDMGEEQPAGDESVTTDNSEAGASTPDPVENTPEPSTSEPAPEAAPTE